MRTPAVLLAVVLLFATIALMRAESLEWSLINWKIRRDFPGVSRIDATQVDQWLRDPHRAKPLLLDVRTQPEYAVSHIGGARHIEPTSDPAAVEVANDTPIVTYCSVGYRSAAFAKKLKEAGFTHVQNMTGSIFDWANKGYPIEQNGRPVRQVHPYNARWSRLLNKNLRAAVPGLTGSM